MNLQSTWRMMVAIVTVMQAASCGSSVKVTTDYDRTADFSVFKTFGFYQLSDKGQSISDLNKDRIINAIKTEMQKKGFKEDETNPDLLVNATVVLQDKKSVTANTNYYGYGGYYRPYGWGPGFSGTTTYNVYNYKDGSLIIDILRASGKQLVWQGAGNKEIDKPSKDPDQIISSAVQQIMAGFPPGLKK